MKKHVFIFFLWIILTAMLASCKTVVHEFEVVHTSDTTIVYKASKDSIFLHDSIYVSEKSVNDTVYLTKEKYITRWKDRELHDSIYINKTDTIVKTEIKEVEKPLKWWQQWLAGMLALIALIGMSVIILSFDKR